MGGGAQSTMRGKLLQRDHAYHEKQHQNHHGVENMPDHTERVVTIGRSERDLEQYERHQPERELAQSSELVVDKLRAGDETPGSENDDGSQQSEVNGREQGVHNA